MGQKRILHVIEYFNIAGAEIVVKNLILTLPQSKWHTEVCVLNDHGVLGRELQALGYNIHSLNWRKDKLTDIQLAQKLRSIIRSNHIDLVHAHNLTPWYFTVLATVSTRLKRCVTLHGFIRGEGSSKKKILYSLLSQLTSRIIIVSEEIENQLCHIPFLNMKKVEVVLNGIDIKIPGQGFERNQKRESLGFSKHDFVIGTVGRIYPEKNIGMQIELIHSLLPQIPNIKLAVVGNKYAYVKSLEDLMKQLKIQDRVLFLGLRRDIPELLRTFDIFLMSSFSEGTSLALLEAMACGLPVIASDVGGNGSIISHGENGFLFDVTSLEALRHYVLELYNDAEKRLRLGNRAKILGERYSIQSMVDRYHDLYLSIFN
jgi:glycosyltransferase involved in cell wall biosynthesis